MATPTYTQPTAVAPEDVERVHPVSIGMHGLANNRDYVAAGAVGKVGASELLLSTTSRLGVWREYEMLAGWPVDYGEVADAAALLALHNWSADPHETAVYRYVAPGDSCTRLDDPGYRWVCIAGHGTAIEHWERCILPAGVDAVVSAASDELSSRISDVEEALDEISTEIPVASATVLGGVKIGSGLEISADGVLSAIGAGAIALSWLATDWIENYAVGPLASLADGAGWDEAGAAFAALRASDWLDALSLGLHSTITTGTGWAAAGAALT